MFRERYDEKQHKGRFAPCQATAVAHGGRQVQCELACVTAGVPHEGMHEGGDLGGPVVYWLHPQGLDVATRAELIAELTLAGTPGSKGGMTTQLGSRLGRRALRIAEALYGDPRVAGDPVASFDESAKMRIVGDEAVVDLPTNAPVGAEFYVTEEMWPASAPLMRVVAPDGETIDGRSWRWYEGRDVIGSVINKTSPKEWSLVSV